MESLFRHKRFTTYLSLHLKALVINSEEALLKRFEDKLDMVAETANEVFQSFFQSFKVDMNDYLKSEIVKPRR